MANVSGINRERYTIPANSVKTIDYKDSQPNYFHIQNIGFNDIYFSCHSIPTEKLYDMKVNAGSIGTFTDSYKQAEVYFYNPSNVDVDVIVSTFNAPFDPVVLAQANKQITIGGRVETDGIVRGFETPLPTGTNKIGTVTLDNYVNTLLNDLKNATVQSRDNTKTIINKQTELFNRVTAINEKSATLITTNGEINNKLEEINSKLDDASVISSIDALGDNIESPITILPKLGHYISKVCAFECTKTCELIAHNENGEIIWNIPFANSNVSYRAINMSGRIDKFILHNYEAGNEPILYTEQKPFTEEITKTYNVKDVNDVNELIRGYAIKTLTFHYDNSGRGYDIYLLTNTGECASPQLSNPSVSTEIFDSTNFSTLDTGHDIDYYLTGFRIEYPGEDFSTSTMTVDITFMPITTYVRGL